MPVAGATVEEQILDNIVTTLQAITSDSLLEYNNTYTEVRRQYSNIEDVRGLPALIILHQGTTQDDSQLGIIKCVMTIAIVGAINTASGDWQGDLSLVIADVTHALRDEADEGWTRGGLAVTTRITNTEIFDSEDTGTAGLVACQITAEIVFRHLYDDATSAI